MIIGITGPICAGKDEAGRLLANLGFERLSLVEALRAEARDRGMEITRKGLQDLGDEMRRSEGVDVLARRVMKHVIPGRNYVIESIRNPGEVAALRELGEFLLLCVRASDHVRFERMIARGREQDPKTFEDFLAVEARDRGIGQAPHAQQNEACWNLADITITNDHRLEDLSQTLREILSRHGYVPRQLVQVITALPSEAAAMDLVRVLLEQRVIACAQVIPSRSLFWWQGKIQEVPEWVCLLKGSDFSAIEKALRAKHPYEIPEIVQLTVDRSNSDYASWLTRETVT